MSDEIVECLERQLSELEALACIYEDLSINSHDIEEAKRHLESGGELESVEIPTLQCSLTLKSHDEQALLLVALPATYPMSDPNLCLLPECAIDLDTVLREVRTDYEGMERLTPLLSLVMEAFNEYALKRKDAMAAADAARLERQRAAATCPRCSSLTCTQIGEVSLMRQGAYSHHIISGWKRGTMLMLAARLKLGGVMKAGWPGLVIVEGEMGAVVAFFREVSRWQWKRFVIRAEETVVVRSSDGVSAGKRVSGGRGTESKGKGTARPTGPVVSFGGGACFESVEHIEAALDAARAFQDGFVEFGPELSIGAAGERCEAAGVKDVFDAVLKCA